MAIKTNSPYETILDSIADGVFTVDLEYNITYFNRSAETITGVSREQALGQKCFDVFRANICQTACALGKTMQSGKQGHQHSRGYSEQPGGADIRQCEYIGAPGPSGQYH